MLKLTYALCGLIWVLTFGLAIAAAAHSSAALQPGESKIRLTGSLVEERSTFLGPSKTFALWNKPAYEDRLGTAFYRCVTVAKGWVECSETIRLARGEIVAAAVVPSAASFRTLAVTGGTGIYANVAGTLAVQPLGAGQLIVANLIGI